jgi:hypothetical protein
VIDLPAALTIVNLGLVDKLNRILETIYVPQTAVDEALEELENYRAYGHLASMTIGMYKGEYVRREISAEEHDMHQRWLERLLAFLQSSAAKIVPAEMSIEMSPGEFQKISKVLGRSSLDAISVAVGKKVILYSDDLHLRSFAANQFGASYGISTIDVINKLRFTGAIDDTAFFKCLRTLILSNYYYVRASTEFLSWILEENQMCVNREVDKIFRVVFGSDCSASTAVTVASGVLLKVWLSVPLHHQKNFMLDFLCGILIQHPESRKILLGLKGAVMNKFHLYPQPLPVILSRIDFWLARA